MADAQNQNMTDPNPLSSSGGGGGFDLGALLNNPVFQTGIGMIGTNAAIGPAFQQAAAAAQANKAAQQQNAIRQLQLQQLNARANFNPSQYLLNNQAQNASPQAAGPATQAALAAQQGPQAGAQIAANTATPYQAPQGALGNVDIQGMLGAGLKAGMSPEEVQNMAGVIDPMTAIRMKLMSQPALVVPPGGQLVAPGMSQIAQTFGGQGGSAQAPQGGAAPGVLATNTNLPPDSQAAQIMNLTRARDLYPVGSPQYASLDSALIKANGSQEQALAQQKQNIENVKTFGDPAASEAYAQAVARGQMPAPASRVQTPATQAFNARVLAINPSYSAQDYEAKQQAVNSFAAGPHGDILRSQAVAINHLGQLNTLVDALGNNNKPIVNQVANAWAKQNGGTAPSNFEAAKPIVTDEVMKAVLGAGGALGDRDTAQKALDNALTTQQLKGVLNQYTGLLQGQRQGLAQQYQTATGRNDFEDRFPLNMPTPKAPTTASPVANFSVSDRMAEARRRGLIQ